MRKIVYFMVLIAFGAFLGCSRDGNDSKDFDEKPQVGLRSIAFDPEAVSLKIGETYKLNPKYTPESLTAPEYSYSTSDAGIVSISGNLIKAEAEGNAVIKAMVVGHEALTAELQVTVSKITADSIRILEGNQALKVGDSKMLHVVIKPENTTDQEVEWSSAQKEIAKVSSTGELKALVKGKTWIRAFLKSDPSVKDSIEVEVQPILPTTIEIQEGDFSMTAGDHITLSLGFVPANTTSKIVTWNTSDPRILTVSGTGEVQALREGTAEVMAKSTEADVSDKVQVTVKLKGLSLNKSSLQLLTGDEENVRVFYQLAGDAYKKARWTSSNPNIASVSPSNSDPSQVKIKALATGMATITAISDDGTKRVSLTVNVQDISAFILGGSIVDSLGFDSAGITGNLRNFIRNGSNQKIFVKSFWVIDGNNRVWALDANIGSQLIGGNQLEYRVVFQNAKQPVRFIWKYEWQGKEYQLVTQL